MDGIRFEDFQNNNFLQDEIVDHYNFLSKNRSDYGLQEIRRRRTSRNNNYESKFTCDSCEKSYLSYAALYTHRKNKHTNLPNDTREPRRSRKELRNIHTSVNFLSNGALTQGQTAFEQLDVLFNEAFDKIYFKSGRTNILPKYGCYNRHPLFETFYEFSKLPLKLERIMSSIDLIMANYIFESKDSFEAKTILVLLKYVMLFRDYLNSYFFSTKGVYTAVTNAEDLPEKINDFILKFLVLDEDMFGMEVFEIIEYSQHFCDWLYSCSFSSLKITLCINFNSLKNI